MRPQDLKILIKLTDINIATWRSTDCKLPDDGLVKAETCSSIGYIF